MFSWYLLEEKEKDMNKEREENKQLKKKYFCICNHWTECGIGQAFPKGFYDGHFFEKGFSTVYTVEKMLDGADDFEIIVGMELDAYSYEVLTQVSPKTLQRLKKYIHEGKASVDGGSYGQPLGQDYGWESNIRQLTYGKKVIRSLLDCDVLTFLVEEQWFFPQLPQLLKKCEFLYATLQCQNSGQVFPKDTSMIHWEGLDGTLIPTIPANNIMVSCIRQYGDYQEYEKILDTYENPLLFQWVEIWTPGMDWGASISPFEKSIEYIHNHGFIPTTLDDYFMTESHVIDKQKLFIDFDSSNYGNDWYQGGGWGYEGDKVIYQNNIVEQKIATLEASNFFKLIFRKGYLNTEQMDIIWKALLVLQNHDTSVARSYRAYTPDGIKTSANDLVLARYKKLESKINSITNGLELKMGNNTIAFPLYNESMVTTTFFIKCQNPVGIKISGKEVVCGQYMKNDLRYVSIPMKVVPYQMYEIYVYDKDMQKPKKFDVNKFEYDGVEVAHKGGGGK